MTSYAMILTALLLGACGARTVAGPTTNVQGLSIALPPGTVANGRFEWGHATMRLAGRNSVAMLDWGPSAPPTRDTVVADAVRVFGGPMDDDAVEALEVSGGVGWAVTVGNGGKAATIATVGCDRRRYLVVFTGSPDDVAHHRRMLDGLRCEPAPDRTITPSAVTDVVTGWSRIESEDGQLVLAGGDRVGVNALVVGSIGTRFDDDEETELVAQKLRDIGVTAPIGPRAMISTAWDARAQWDIDDPGTGLRFRAQLFYCDTPLHAVLGLASAPAERFAEAVRVLATMRCRAPGDPFPLYPVAR